MPDAMLPPTVTCMAEIANATHSYPASLLETASVSDFMHKGVLTCAAETPLCTLGRLMADERVHSVVVSGIPEAGEDSGRAWCIVSHIDLLQAALAGDLDRAAGEIAATEFLIVDADATLEPAAQLMTEHEVTHLVVLDPETGQAVGVLSTLDVAGAIGSKDKI